MFSYKGHSIFVFEFVFVFVFVFCSLRRVCAVKGPAIGQLREILPRLFVKCSAIRGCILYLFCREGFVSQGAIVGDFAEIIWLNIQL